MQEVFSKYQPSKDNYLKRKKVVVNDRMLEEEEEDQESANNYIERPKNAWKMIKVE